MVVALAVSLGVPAALGVAGAARRVRRALPGACLAACVEVAGSPRADRDARAAAAAVAGLALAAAYHAPRATPAERAVIAVALADPALGLPADLLGKILAPQP